jgi:hypothetical protein
VYAPPLAVGPHLRTWGSRWSRRHSGSARLGGQPSDGRDLVLGEPRPRVALAAERAPVQARAHQTEAAQIEPLAAKIPGRADERHVLVEPHPLGEAFRRHVATDLPVDLPRPSLGGAVDHSQALATAGASFGQATPTPPAGSTAMPPARRR